MKRILAVSALGLALLAMQPASAWYEPARFDKDQKTETTKIPNFILSRLNQEVGPLLKAGKIETATNILMNLLPKTDSQVVELIDQVVDGDAPTDKKSLKQSTDEKNKKPIRGKNKKSDKASDDGSN